MDGKSMWINIRYMHTDSKASLFADLSVNHTVHHSWE